MTTLGKIVFSLLALIIIISAAFLLFLNNKDTLAKTLPPNTSFYIHTYPQVINKLAENQKNYYLHNSFLLNLDKNQAQSISALITKELAIFKKPDQSLKIATYSNQELLDFLNTEKIPLVYCDDIIIFPETSSVNYCNTNDNLAKNAQFKPKNAIFSDGYLYYSGNEANFLPEIAKNYAITDFSAYFKIKNQVITIKSTLPSINLFFRNDQQSWQSQINQTTILYSRNVDFSQMPLTAALIKENLYYRLLKKIGRVEAFSYSKEKSFLTVRQHDRTIDQLENFIKEELSYLLPEEQPQELPDGTPAINLIANPNLWQFTRNENQGSYLEVTELGLTFTIENNQQSLNLTISDKSSEIEQNDQTIQIGKL
jgi:hypothetical protein